MKEAIELFLSNSKIEHRKYQKRVIYKTLTHFVEDKMSSVLIESPCGSGKTIMALSIVKLLQEMLGIKVGWIAMRKNLLVQAEKENYEKYIDADIEFISMFDKDPPKKLDLLVIDEAQHDSTDSCAHLHNIIKPKYILGLSGTPWRADRVKLCFDKIVKDAGIRALITEGYLSHYHHYNIPLWNPKTVAEFYNKEKDRWGKSIIYFRTIKEAFECAEYIKRSEVVTGTSDREEQIERFTEGKTPVLINCMVLTEGFDFPALQTVFCRPGSKGPTIQMCGRAFRKHAKIPFKNVVQDKSTKYPFIKTVMPLIQHNWQEGEWRSIEPNQRVDEAQENVMKSLARINNVMPELLTKKDKKRGQRRRNVSF